MVSKWVFKRGHYVCNNCMMRADNDAIRPFCPFCESLMSNYEDIVLELRFEEERERKANS